MHESHKHTYKHSGVQTLMNTHMHAMNAQTSKCASNYRGTNTQRTEHTHMQGHT